MKAFLILEDGHVFEGTSIGSAREVISEIVFIYSSLYFIYSISFSGQYASLTLLTLFVLKFVLKLSILYIILNVYSTCFFDKKDVFLRYFLQIVYSNPTALPVIKYVISYNGTLYNIIYRSEIKPVSRSYSAVNNLVCSPYTRFVGPLGVGYGIKTACHR